MVMKQSLASYLRLTAVSVAAMLGAAVVQAQAPAPAAAAAVQQAAPAAEHANKAKHQAKDKHSAKHKAAKHGKKTKGDKKAAPPEQATLTEFERNALRRCEVYKGDEERRACAARVRSAPASGSVQSGGVMREATQSAPMHHGKKSHAGDKPMKK